MSEAVARCTHPLYAIHPKAAAAGLPVLKQDAVACVRMRIMKKPSEHLTGLFLHFARKMLRFAEFSLGSLAVRRRSSRCSSVVPRLDVLRKLGNDSSDDVGQLGSEAGDGFAFPDMLADLGDSVRQIHVGGHERVFPARILAERFGNRIFDVSYAGAGKVAVHVDADDRRVAEHDRMRLFDAGHAFGQSFQMVFDRQIRCMVCRMIGGIVG